MKTFILLTPMVNQTITKDDINELIRFVGLMNINKPELTDEAPGVPFNGTLNHEQKEELINYFRSFNDKGIVPIFIEYLDDQPFESNTVLMKEE